MMRSSSRTSSPCAPISSRRSRRNAGDASSRTVPSPSMARSIASSSRSAAMRRAANGSRYAVASAGRRGSRNADCVRRLERSSVATAESCAPSSAAPSRRRRASGWRTSGIGSGFHPPSPLSTARIACTRANSAASQSRSVRGLSARTAAAPSVDDARSATTSSTRGNSRTARA